MTELKKLAIIPARGGSKRIPRKNIRPFHGKPIIGYSIEAARRTGLFDKIIVSTDDEEIAKVAESFGAEIPFFRPPELASDHTATGPVICHAIDWFAERGIPYDVVCCIYPTAPFLNPSLLIEAWTKLQAGKKRFAFTVTSYAYPIQRSLRRREDGTVEMIWPEHEQTRSQDLEPAYHDAGLFYWGLSDAFLKEEVAFSPISAAVILPRSLVHDIDTVEDWEAAELAYSMLLHSGRLEVA